jgi:hypothetical protein
MRTPVAKPPGARNTTQGNTRVGRKDWNETEAQENQDRTKLVERREPL